MNFDIYGNVITTPVNVFDKEDPEDHPSSQTRVDYLRSREDEDFGENKENLIPYTRERIFTPNKPTAISAFLPRSPFLDITPPPENKRSDKGSSINKNLFNKNLFISPDPFHSNSNVKQFR